MGAGGLSLLLPSAAAASVEGWLLPALSILALVFAIAMAGDWRSLGGGLAVLGLALVVGWIKAAGSASSNRHLGAACLGLLLMVLVGKLVDTPVRLRAALLLTLGGGLLMLLLALGATDLPASGISQMLVASGLPPISLGLPGLDSTGRVNPNALAVAALLVTPIGAAVLLLGTGDRRDAFTLRPLGLAVVMFGALALAVSHSRSAALAIWVTLVVLLARINNWVARLVVATLVVALPAMAAGVSLANTHDDFHLQADEVWQTVYHRARIFRAGVKLLEPSRWFGIGLNEFRHQYQPEPQDVLPEPLPHVHNTVLQTALDIGLVGLAAYGYVIWLILVTANRVARDSGNLCRSAAVGGAFSIVAASLFGLADALAIGAKVGMLQWLAAGLILAAWRSQSCPDPLSQRTMTAAVPMHG